MFLSISAHLTDIKELREPHGHLVPEGRRNLRWRPYPQLWLLSSRDAADPSVSPQSNR